MSWSQTEIVGKRADLFHPDADHPPEFGVLFLHPVGGETLIDNAAYTEELQRHNFVCCVPHGQRSWWSNRICPEFDDVKTAETFLLDDVIPFMLNHWRLQGIAIAGISMGGQGAIRLGFKYPERFPVVAGIASAFDYYEWYGQGTPIDTMYDSREACRQDSAILHIDPRRCPEHIFFACDPFDGQWHRGNDRLHEKLSAYGIPHTADLDTEAGGHTWAYFDAMAPTLMQFLADALKQRSRRLL